LQKVFITCLHLKHGGVEMAITTLANALAELGMSVEILCTYHFGNPAYEVNPKVKINYLTTVLPNREAMTHALSSHHVISAFREGFRALKILYIKKQTMKKAIEKIKDGTIISTRNEHSVLLSKYGNCEVKKIAQLHSDHNFDRKLIRCFQTKYSNIDFFVLLTPKTQREVQGFLKGFNDHTKCITIPNFIQEIKFEQNPVKKNQIIAAGRLHPDKDFASLLRIWALVHARKPDFVLKIAGEGPLKNELQMQAEQLGISASVRFLGAIPHDTLLREMSVSYCYALTSVSESFGLVLAESMMCGTVPVAFNVRVGPEAIIDDRINGFLIPDRNESLFADKIIELIENQVMRIKMQEQAEIKSKQFTKAQVLPKWIGIING
jgi:N-acetylglucosaminyldiphosphoundecaprenol N-acetyl-beta-D-mannosaminyltransferase